MLDFGSAAKVTPFASDVEKRREAFFNNLLGMYTLFTIGVALWGIYGYLRGDWAILAANAITGVLCPGILIVKLRNDGLRSKSG